MRVVQISKVIKKYLNLNSMLLLSSALINSPSYSNPVGGQVVAGNATITTPTANTVQINQTSNKAIIDWQSYNINEHEQVHYVQPSANSIALNRINPQNGGSLINGELSANGEIWLINPAGITFGANAIVDVSGLLATTANINNADFMSGNYHFVQSDLWNSAVINNGRITIKDEGIAALVAPGVANNGIINARLGTIILASGKEYTLDFYGDQLIQFGMNAVVTQPAVTSDGKMLKDAVSNDGQLSADGGKVLLTAQTAGNVLEHAVNMSGHIQANSVSQQNGVIILSGGTQGKVLVTGTISASGDGQNQTGGTIKVLGDQIQVIDNAKLDASGTSGGGNILIGGNFHGAGPDQNASYTIIGKNVKLNANALIQGNGGNIAVWSNLGTQFYGHISVRGGLQSGDGGFVETSGEEYLDAMGHVNASAIYGKAGQWLLDSRSVEITTSTAHGDFDGGTITDTFTTDSSTGHGQVATVNVDTINNALNAGTNVTILTTPGTGNGNAGAGNITVSSAITNNSSSNTPTLTLNAAGTITINQSISFGGTASGLNVSLISGGAITQGANGAIKASSLSVTNTAANTTLTNAGNAINSLGNIIATGRTFSLTDNIAIGLTQSGILNANSLNLTNTKSSTTLNNAGNNINNLNNINAAGQTFTLTNTGTTNQTGSLIANTFNYTNTSSNTTLNNSGNAVYVLGTINTTGKTFTLTDNVAGGLTQSGSLIANTLVLTNTASSTTLNNANNAINVLGTINATGQTFSLTDNIITGLTQSGALSADTLSLTNAGGSTTLNNAGNTINYLGTISASGQTFNLVNSVALQQASGTTITASKIIVLTQNDNGAAIVLDNAGNSISTIDLRSRNSNNTANAAGDIQLNDAIGLDIANISTNGHTTITTTGAITETSGTITVGGDVNLTANLVSGNISVSNGNLTINANNINNATLNVDNNTVINANNLLANINTKNLVLSVPGNVNINGSINGQSKLLALYNITFLTQPSDFSFNGVDLTGGLPKLYQTVSQLGVIQPTLPTTTMSPSGTINNRDALDLTIE